MRKETDQHKKEKVRKKCVDLAKKIIKIKAGYHCEYRDEKGRCPRSKKNGYQMHGSHIYGENSNKSMSADTDNLLCFCATHHTGGMWKNAKEPSWHESPKEMVNWFDKTFPIRAIRLEERSRKTTVCDLYYWQKKEILLKDELGKLSTFQDLTN